MKLKLPLIATAFCLSLGLSAQKGKLAVNNNAAQIKTNLQTFSHRTCGSQAPGAEWDNWFNQKVEEFKALKASGKAQLQNYTIPVIVHIIHGGQAPGTFPNISQTQVNSQITVLNADYAGNGQNVGNLPSVFASAKANTGISFCLAQKDPNGNVLTEPGIDRINYITKGWNNPAGSSYNTPLAFQNYVNSTIKPGSIWDPTQYLNIWITDENQAVGLLGFATFPSGTGLNGLGSSFGTATTDGVWCYTAAFGSSLIAPGTYASGFNLGRTAAHEIGHWLGLRHIGGDGNNNPAGDCNASDFCADTPPQKGGLNGGQFGQNYGCGTFPLNANVCANPNGDMFMNFMDYSDDACMYIFTNDQNTRMQTAMANGTYRSQLSASAATLCSLPASAPTASFAMQASACTNSSINVTNLSNGTPQPSYIWSANPSTGVTFNPNNTASAPSINFTTPGAYSITVVATNTVGTNSSTKIITINTCTTASTCADTISNFGLTDTLTIYRAGADINTAGCSPNAGYVCGNNCYGDLEKAEFYSLSKYSSIASPQIKSVIVLFFKNGTFGTGGNSSSSVGLRLYNSTSTTFTGMPSGIAPGTSIGFTTTTLGTILAQPSVSNVAYCGDPSVFYNSAIIKPYRFVFSSPVNAPATTGFFASVVLPTGAGDTVVIMNNDNASANRSYERWSPASPVTWFEMKNAWGGVTNYNLAILPEMQCASPTGINPNSVLDKNVTLYPNPTNGLVNIIATLPNTQALEITLHNAMGQFITSSKYTGVTNNVFTLDLNNYSNGVYFVTINNGNEKIVKRLIFNK